MAQEFRLDELKLTKSELIEAALVAKRAIFNDPFFSLPLI